MGAASPLAGVSIDCLVNNAGISGGDDFSNQKLGSITMDTMRLCFEVNSLGPLRVTKALMGQISSPGGKVVVISTGLASIGDNGSGGMYAYRTSKAAVNMVTKSLAVDLAKDGKGIAVRAIAPGIVATNFGGSVKQMEDWGAAPVGQAVAGVLQAIDDLTVESTGRFFMVPSNGSAPKEFPW